MWPTIPWIIPVMNFVGMFITQLQAFSWIEAML